jgi:hypothetical protein
MRSKAIRLSCGVISQTEIPPYSNTVRLVTPRGWQRSNQVHSTCCTANNFASQPTSLWSVDSRLAFRSPPPPLRPFSDEGKIWPAQKEAVHCTASTSWYFYPIPLKTMKDPAANHSPNSHGQLGRDKTNFLPFISTLFYLWPQWTSDWPPLSAQRGLQVADTGFSGQERMFVPLTELSATYAQFVKERSRP